MHGEDNGVALVERNDLGAALHARALLGQDEFPAEKVSAWRREQGGSLKGEDKLAVNILVQAIEVARTILK